MLIQRYIIGGTEEGGRKKASEEKDPAKNYNK